jgi:hypothetical protein
VLHSMLSILGMLELLTGKKPKKKNLKMRNAHNSRPMKDDWHCLAKLADLHALAFFQKAWSSLDLHVQREGTG